MIHTYPEWLSSRLVGPGLESESDESLLWKIMQMAKRRITHARETLDLPKVRRQQINQLANHTWRLTSRGMLLDFTTGRYIFSIHRLL